MDLLLSPAGEPGRVGLIYRAGAQEGIYGWCVVGGRVLHGERLSDAADRHVRATLGKEAVVDQVTLRFGTVIEYLPEPGAEFYDPLKHSIGLSYTAECHGDVQPEGEALDFRWFPLSELASLENAFNQGEVVARLLSATGRSPG